MAPFGGHSPDRAPVVHGHQPGGGLRARRVPFTDSIEQPLGARQLVGEEIEVREDHLQRRVAGEDALGLGLEGMLAGVGLVVQPVQRPRPLQHQL